MLVGNNQLLPTQRIFPVLWPLSLLSLTFSFIFTFSRSLSPFPPACSTTTAAPSKHLPTHSPSAFVLLFSFASSLSLLTQLTLSLFVSSFPFLSHFLLFLFSLSLSLFTLQPRISDVDSFNRQFHSPFYSTTLPSFQSGID